jgi:hypothetical protein
MHIFLYKHIHLFSKRYMSFVKTLKTRLNTSLDKAKYKALLVKKVIGNLRQYRYLI